MAKLKASDVKRASDSSPITKFNFFARAVDYEKANPDRIFVVRGPRDKRQGANSEGEYTPAQWRAWLAYLEGMGVPTVVMRAQGVATVPTEWPEDFDSSAPGSDKGWAPPLGDYEFPADHRARMKKQLAVLFRQLGAEINAGPDPLRPHRKTEAELKAEAIAAVEAGFPHLQGPITVSNRLKSNIMASQDEMRKYLADQ